MARFVFHINPLEHGYDASRPMSKMNPLYANYPTINCRIEDNRVVKRWGYSLDRDLGVGAVGQHVVIFDKSASTTYTLFLTETDLCKREGGSGKTFSYQTETYTTGTITDITGAVVTGSGTNWSSSGVAAGDYFILDDDHSDDSEPDTNWAKIKSVDSDTQITLESSYSGTTGSMSKNYKIRKIYSVPTNERWAWTIVDDKFVFTNGDVDVQYWDGTGYASALDSTYAKKARYCIEYANRLFLADVEISGNREPYSILWSKEGDPTTFDPAEQTAGQADILDTATKITGLGKVGTNLVVYQEDAISIWGRTGVASSPISRLSYLMGIGLYAPYSLVHFLSTNAFLGRDDFYIMVGNAPQPIGEKIRHLFFDLVDINELKNVWGVNFRRKNEIAWFTNTTDGLLAFAWNYKNKEWSIYEFNDVILGAGAT